MNFKQKLPAEEYNNIYSIAKKLDDNGFETYLVGGSVRDLFLDIDVYDFDLATDAKPQEIIKIFRKVVPTGIKHGTVSILIDDKVYEITTFRADGKYVDGRHPETISFSNSIEEDVTRRDFTINGIVYNIIKNEILDVVGGIKDLSLKVIRTIGKANDRFSEDGLRPIRACRFAAKLNFVISPETEEAIKNNIEVVKLVSIERIRDELKKILETDKPSIAFEYLRTSGLLQYILPELDKCYGVDQNKYHTHDVYYHSLYSCDAAPKNRSHIRLAALLHDIGKVATRRRGPDGEFTFHNHEVIGTKIAVKVLRRLKFSNDEIAKVKNLVNNHMFHYTDEWTDGAVRRFIRKVGVGNIDDLIELRMADRKGNGSREGFPYPIKKLMKRIEKVIEEENAITVKDLNIDGKVLIEELSLKTGPLIGQVLHYLLEIILDDPEKNKRESLLDLAKDYMSTLSNPIEKR